MEQTQYIFYADNDDWDDDRGKLSIYFTNTSIGLTSYS